MSRVKLSIDHIALRGFAAADRAALLAGLEAELRRLLADPAARASLTTRRTPVLKLGRVAFTPGPAGGRAFGGKLGRAIGKGLK